MRILMVAAENDAIAGMKVGGVADVIRDIPQALAKLEQTIDVIVPDYGLIIDREPHQWVANIQVSFKGQSEQVGLFKLTKQNGEANVQQWLVKHDLFAMGGKGQVYCNDPDNRPFASDATKFALFSAAVTEALHQQALPRPNYIHLHDWHSACVAVLINSAPCYHDIAQIPRVFTVHNIALQGIRPFKDDDSAFETWFPHLSYNGEVICDPRYPHCFNPMRAAINLCDKVHVVSPSYAQEVIQPSQPELGFFGGEGIEADLQHAQAQGRLSGILNGCEYGEQYNIDTSLDDFYLAAEKEILRWAGQNSVLQSAHYLASQRLLGWQNTPSEGPLITSVGRLTDQKMLLMRDGGLQKTLDVLKSKDARLVILGSGDQTLEQELTKVMAINDNFLFLNGFALGLSNQIYSLGDLFLMPSSFEPCGISQMLSMRAGQPCLVHAVGGLKDTVLDMENGFAFTGESLELQLNALLASLEQALNIYSDNPEQWHAIAEQAKQTRFTWQDSAKQYVTQLYI